MWGFAAGLAAAVDGLAGASLWRLGGDEVVDVMRVVECQARRLFAASLRLVAEVDARGLGTDRGACSTPALLRQVLNVTPAEAGWRVAAAEKLLGRTSPSGQIEPAALPVTAAGVADGGIESGQARLIFDTLRRLPAGVDPPTRARAEAFLAGQARDFDAHALAGIARRMVATLDPDGAVAAEEEAVRYRELSFGRSVDGMTVVRGRLDAEGAAVLRTAIDPFTAPAPSTAADGPDPRSPARRAADGLIELARRALTAGDLPDAGGLRPQLTVTLDFDSLRKQLGAGQPGRAGTGEPGRAGTGMPGRAGTGLLGWGGPVTAESARRIACDAQLIPVLLGGGGQPLDVGRASYSIPTGIRRALIARDRGCAFPGCDRPPAWCDGHHIRHWADGGPTAITNLVLLCGHHHRTVHHHGWQTRIVHGQPQFLPPPWIDPTQTPRRNHYHHLPTLPDPPGRPDPPGVTAQGRRPELEPPTT